MFSQAKNTKNTAQINRTYFQSIIESNGHHMVTILGAIILVP